MCCYNGNYYACSEQACFGGFDLEGCLDACNDADCIEACVDQLSNAGPPTAACKPAQPDPNVTCG